MAVSAPRSLIDQWWKVGGAAGILFVVLFIIGGVILQGDTPMVDDSASDIKDYFVDHPNKYIVGDFVIGLGFIFGWLPFASALRAFLGLAESGPAVWSRLIFAGALLLTAVGAASSGFQGALAYNAAAFTDDNLLKTLITANYYTFTTVAPFAVALTVLSSSIVILRTRAMWQWLGVFGVVLAVAAIVSSLSVLDDDPAGPLGILGIIAFIAWGVWTLAASAGLLMKTEAPAAA